MKRGKTDACDNLPFISTSMRQKAKNPSWQFLLDSELCILLSVLYFLFPLSHMKKFMAILAASALAMTMAVTSFAMETAAPGQQCAGLAGQAKRNCIRGAVTAKKQKKMEMRIDKRAGKMVKRMTKRTVTEMERGRQRGGGNAAVSSSSSATSSSSSAASSAQSN